MMTYAWEMIVGTSSISTVASESQRGPATKEEGSATSNSQLLLPLRPRANVVRCCRSSERVSSGD